MAVVVFVYADWQAIYPQFTTTVTTEAQAVNCFNLATGVVNNDTCGLVPYAPDATPPILNRLTILYLLTAHLAQLQYGAVIGGTLVPAGPLVGRISSATQGSVSVATQMDGPQSAAWFNQTQWGATAWQLLAPYRTGHYIANPGRFAFVGAPYPDGYYRGRGRW